MKSPPRKQPGQGRGRRRVNGVVMDVATAAAFVGISPKAVRGKVERRLIPFRRFGARIVFLRSELERYLATLDGCGLDEALQNMRERQ